MISNLPFKYRGKVRSLVWGQVRHNPMIKYQ